MKKIILMLVLVGLLSSAFYARKSDQSDGALLVAPSSFRLLAENVSYDGEECTPRDEIDQAYADRKNEIIKIGDDYYYEGHRFWTVNRGDGLVRENFAAKTCRIYRLSGLVTAGGWKYKDRERSKVPDSTRTLYRVRQRLWMGSNGVGIAIYDLERKTWSRIDLKEVVIPGDHLSINYADDDYVFVTRGEFPATSWHVYSVKKNKWLGLRAVATKQFREFGYTTGMVQVNVDHSIFAKALHVPIDWTFMGLRATLIDNGQTYLFEKRFSDTKTVFEIGKAQLEQIFLQNKK